MIRYNALYYPFISIIVLISAKINYKFKWAGIITIALLLGLFIAQTEYEYYKETKTVQYSAFGGWELAANALYGYAHVIPIDSSFVPKEFRPLHTLVNRHMDSIKQLSIRPDREVALYYLWNQKSPLKVYMAEKFPRDTSNKYFYRWASMGPLYAKYGKYLIFHYPIAFISYYLWPNLIKYYSPPVGFMAFYNLGNSQVDSATAKWFGWKSRQISNHFKTKKINITEAFPIIIAIINLTFVTSIISFAFLGGFKKQATHIRKILLLIFSVWISNMLFSVFSAPIELRYQIFPMIITFSFLWIFMLFLTIESGKSEHIQ